MKKLLAIAALPFLTFFFFSCQSTGAAIPKALEVQELEDEGGAEENLKTAEAEQNENTEQSSDSQGEPSAEDPAALEEKIPQSEFDEMAELLKDDQTKDADVSDDGQEESAAAKITQAQDGSLQQKIIDSNKSAEQNANATTDFQNESKDGSASGGSVSGAGLVSASGGSLASQSAGNGAGTSLDKNARGRDDAPGAGSGNNFVAPASTSATSSANSPSRDAAAEAPNEGIALSAPASQTQEEAAPEEKKLIPLPSRSMTLKNKQFVDITYPGSGWIYLGEEDGGDHFIFQGRKLGNDGATFTLRSKAPGTALLHFYKNDILTGNYIDDWIQVTVSENGATDASHVQAPAYADVVPQKFDLQKNKEQKEKALAEAAAKKQAERDEMIQAEKAEEKSPSEGNEEKRGQVAAAPNPAQQSQTQAEIVPAEKVQTVIQTAGQEKADSKQKTAVAGTNSDKNKSQAAQGSGEKAARESQAQGDSSASTSDGKAKNLLELARKAYDEKRFEEALDLVQKFFDVATEDLDAGLYLEGLILEAKSSARNIKSAIGAYDTLIKNWPQSPYWRRANERSIYLKRFYIDIR